MSRTRAERRHNTEVKTSARKALAIRNEIDLSPVHGYCGGKISLNGEARSCSRCVSENLICGWMARPTINDLRDAEWLRISLTDSE